LIATIDTEELSTGDAFALPGFLFLHDFHKEYNHS